MKTTLSVLVGIACMSASTSGAMAQASRPARPARPGAAAAATAQGGTAQGTTAQRSNAPGGTAQGGNAPAAAGNAQAGKDLYLQYSCYACHGYAGHGGAGARLVPSRMSLPAFTAYVRNPRQMPPYTGKVLSDAQVADVWAYIQTLPKSPAAKDIPLLSQMLTEK